MRAFYLFLLSLLAAVASLPVAAQGVVDGDTLRLSGTTYRLWGIDAPESKQACVDGWAAGAHAAAHLAALIRDKTVVCEPRTIDRYGRAVALCRAGGMDLSAAMVGAGHAWAFVRYSADYVAQESQARGQRLGLHGHGCQPAWDWRAAQRTSK